MTQVNVEEHFIGAGSIWLDGVKLGATMGDNVCRIIRNQAAPILNGVGGMLAGTDYRTQRDVMELEFTLTELGATELAIITGDATVTTDNDDTVIGEAPDRRLPTTAYRPWDLRVPGLDGAEIRFEIHKGIPTNNPEFTAADSENPIGPRLTIQSRIDPANIEASAWAIRLVPSSGS